MKTIFNMEELFNYYYIIWNYLIVVLMLMKFKHFFSMQMRKNESFLKITFMSAISIKSKQNIVKPRR
jgi:hypothetical protein